MKDTGKNEKDIKHKALHALAEEYPNNIIVDLLANFDEEIVLKILLLYGGRRIAFPKSETIWKSYRNKVIVNTLNIKNDKVIRTQLAEYFGISSATIINNIYHQKKQQKRSLKNSQVEAIVETVYRKNIEKYQKELKKLFPDKYKDYSSLHDEFQNPEDLVLLREQEKIMIEKCRKDVKESPIFIRRKYKINYALKLIMEKIEKNR